MLLQGAEAHAVWLWGWNLASVAEGEGYGPDGAGEMGCWRPGPSTWSSGRVPGPAREGLVLPGQLGWALS